MMRLKIAIPAERRHILADLRAGMFVLAPAPVDGADPEDLYVTRRHLSVQPAIIRILGVDAVEVVTMDPEYVPPHAMKWMKAFAESREALTAMGDSIGVRGDLPEAPEASPCF